MKTKYRSTEWEKKMFVRVKLSELFCVVKIERGGQVAASCRQCK